MLIQRIRGGEDGSLPLAILAAIVAAGIVVALSARIIQSERTVQFDQNFSETLPPADSGINQALFQLNSGAIDPAPGVTAPPIIDTIDGADVTVEVTGSTTSSRSYIVVSESDRDGVKRRIQAEIEEELRFFPGAFGDVLVNPRGTSTIFDSYNPNCRTGNTANCGWGPDRDFGTQRGSLGTNNVMELPGQVQFFPGLAFLYDYDDNPPDPATVTAGDPFGDRCDGTKCTEANVTPVGRRVPVQTDPMFVKTKALFEPGAACDDNDPDTNPRYQYGTFTGPSGPVDVEGPDWVLEEVKNKGTTYTPAPVESYYDSQGLGTPTQSDPLADDFDNFYCADNLEWLGNVTVDADVDTDNPVVVFVRDSVRTAKGAVTACQDAVSNDPCPTQAPPNSGTNCARTASAANPCINMMPNSQRFQVYVAGLPSGSSGGSPAGSQVALGSGSVFSGVLFAPTSSCSTDNSNARVDVYGIMMCGDIDNAGNWAFHYDGGLDDVGTGRLSVARWSEIDPTP